MKLPTDMQTIRDIGVDEWQENFVWPVSEADFHAAYDRLIDEFDLMCDSFEQPVLDLVFCDLRFLTFITQYVHTAAVERWCEDSGTELAIGDRARMYYRPNWPSVAGYNAMNWKFKDVLALSARRFAKRLRFNVHLNPLRNLLDLLRPASVWSLGSFDHHKRGYLERTGEYADHQYLETLIPNPNGGGLPADLEAALTKGIGKLLDSMTQYYRGKFNVNIDGKMLASTWIDRLRPLWQAYDRTLQLKRIPKTLLLSELGRPLHRAVAFALLRRGVEVVGMAHGNAPGYIDHRVTPYSHHAMCTHYICIGRKHAEQFTRLLKHSTMRQTKQTQMSWEESSFYQDIWDSFRAAPSAKSPHKIMVIGSPLRPIRYVSGTGEFFIFKFDIELRLVKLLKQAGYEVTYKAHPEEIGEIKCAFDGIADKIEGRPFEAVYHEADAFVFAHPLSTTFGLALCTNRPIVLIDIEGRNWNRDGYQLLRKRCAMVPAWFSASNRIEFDEQNLVEALQSAEASIDASYVETYMFPETRSGKSSPGTV
jgi:hypothetical protein